MRFKHLAVCAALLALAACDDGPSAHPVLPIAEPKLATAPVGPRWSLYTGQSPTEFLDAAPGWEVGARFTSSKPGKVLGFRFYRASGESGSNYAKLWTSSGTKLAQSGPLPSGTGWVESWLATPVRISANTTYRVSVNTNTRQAKKGGAYVFDGPLSNGPLYSDGGYYGQPTGAMPGTESASYFFIDVIFEEDVPLPNLYVQPGFGTPEVIAWNVCNNGQASAGSFTTRVVHSIYTTAGALVSRNQYLNTSAGLAVGQCTAGSVNRTPGYVDEVEVWVDYYDAIYESSEGDNRRILR